MKRVDGIMSAKDWIADEFTSGDASRFVESLIVVPSQRYIVCCRVSNREQKANLVDQRLNLHRVISGGGGIVDRVIEHVGSGWDCGWLVEAALLARRTGAILVAESTDRFVRNLYFHSQCRPQLQATDQELQDLQLGTLGVRLMTWLSPNMPLSEVRRHQTRRGQQYKGRRGGRPASAAGHKKRRFARKLPVVQFYAWLAEPKTPRPIRWIAHQSGVPVETTRRWLNKYGTG